MKGYISNGAAHVRGLAFVHGLDADYLNGGDAVLSLHPSTIGWKPDIRLHCIGQDKTYSFVTHPTWEHPEVNKEGQARVVMPVRFELSFQLELLDLQQHAFEFHIDDWDRFWILSHHDLFGTSAFPDLGPLSVVLPPIFGSVNIVAAAELVAVAPGAWCYCLRLQGSLFWFSATYMPARASSR